MNESRLEWNDHIACFEIILSEKPLFAASDTPPGVLEVVVKLNSRL